MLGPWPAVAYNLLARHLCPASSIPHTRICEASPSIFRKVAGETRAHPSLPHARQTGCASHGRISKRPRCARATARLGWCAPGRASLRLCAHLLAGCARRLRIQSCKPPTVCARSPSESANAKAQSKQTQRRRTNAQVAQRRGDFSGKPVFAGLLVFQGSFFLIFGCARGLWQAQPLYERAKEVQASNTRTAAYQYLIVK